MIREKSCGAVVYYIKDGERLYLLEEMRQGHFAMPKGHVEREETERQTAQREIREETGLSVRIQHGFREETEFSPYPGCKKRVVYYVAHADRMETVPQPEELRSICWLPYAQAVERLSYENDREILRRAEAFLNARFQRSGRTATPKGD